MVGQGLALLAYVFADGVAWFVPVACFAVGLRAAGGAARQALIARWFTGPERVTTRAGLRVVTNVGIGLGTVVAAVTLVIDTAAAYRITMAGAGVLLLLATAPLFGLDRRVPELTDRLRPTVGDDPDGPRGRSPLTDRTYLGAVAMAAVLAMNFGVQTVGVPLWVAGHTEAPTVVISLLMIVNTVFVAVFQVPASRGTHDILVAGRAVRRAGVLLAVGCGLLAAAAYGGTGPAVVLLVLGAFALAAGEVFWRQATGAWPSSSPTRAAPVPTRGCRRRGTPSPRCSRPPWSPSPRSATAPAGGSCWGRCSPSPASSAAVLARHAAAARAGSASAQRVRRQRDADVVRRRRPGS